MTSSTPLHEAIEKAVQIFEDKARKTRTRGWLGGTPLTETKVWLREEITRIATLARKEALEEAARVCERDFRECDTCKDKPGMPVLCWGCLHNRDQVPAAIRSLITTDKQDI